MPASLLRSHHHLTKLILASFISDIRAFFSGCPFTFLLCTSFFLSSTFSSTSFLGFYFTFSFGTGLILRDQIPHGANDVASDVAKPCTKSKRQFSTTSEDKMTGKQVLCCKVKEIKHETFSYKTLVKVYTVYFTIGYATAVALAKVRPSRCPCPSQLSLLEDPPELCRWHQHLHPPHHRKPQASNWVTDDNWI